MKWLCAAGSDVPAAGGTIRDLSGVCPSGDPAPADGRSCPADGAAEQARRASSGSSASTRTSRSVPCAAATATSTPTPPPSWAAGRRRTRTRRPLHREVAFAASALGASGLPERKLEHRFLRRRHADAAAGRRPGSRAARRRRALGPGRRRGGHHRGEPGFGHAGNRCSSSRTPGSPVSPSGCSPPCRTCSRCWTAPTAQPGSAGRGVGAGGRPEGQPGPDLRHAGGVAWRTGRPRCGRR